MKIEDWMMGKSKSEKRFIPMEETPVNIFPVPTPHTKIPDTQMETFDVSKPEYPFIFPPKPVFPTEPATFDVVQFDNSESPVDPIHCRKPTTYD